jgi:RNA polymerase sigma-70 factor (ECF subfamily)
MLEPHDEDTRAIAWLVLVDGHTQEEVGGLLGLSRKTVGKKLNRFLVAARKAAAETA